MSAASAPVSSGATWTTTCFRMTRMSRARSYVIPVPDPVIRARENSTGPGASTIESLSAYVACSVRTTTPSDEASRTSPVRVIAAVFSPTWPSLLFTVKLRPPPRSSVVIVTPINFVDPFAYVSCFSYSTRTSSREDLNRWTRPPVASTIAPGSVRAATAIGEGDGRLNARTTTIANATAAIAITSRVTLCHLMMGNCRIAIS